MKNFFKSFVFSILILSFLFLTTNYPAISLAASAKKAAPASADKLGKVNAAFEINKMSDMSDYNPANPVIPTGDTIKIAIVAPFSGPASQNGEIFFAQVQWVAHDINKRGGLLVDGKKKLIQVIKADHMSKPDTAKKACERMALEEKVNFLWGADTTMITKIVFDVAKKYKIIAMNPASLSDELSDATHFSRYTFFASPSARSIGQALAYYHGQIRKKEKKFYLINPDYSGGFAVTDAFKEGLRKYYPAAQIVGEDHYKLFLTDFAPYLTKIKSSGADMIFTGAFGPDAANILKQARQMGIMLPFTTLYFEDPAMISAVGIEGSKGIMNIHYYSENEPYFKTKEVIKFYEQWRKAQSKWTSPPYNNVYYDHNMGSGMGFMMATYWMMSVIERAQSTDPEKIIPVWENDTYRYLNGKVVKMRACDHKMIQNMGVYETVPPAQQKVSMNITPYYWFNNCSFWGPLSVIPADKILPWMDEKIDRCSGKNGWGE